MDIINARKVLKKNAMTVRRIVKIIEVSPTDIDFIHSTLRRQGGRDTKSVIARYISALLITGKIAAIQDGIYTTNIPLKGAEQSSAITHDKQDKIQPEPVVSAIPVEPAIIETKPSAPPQDKPEPMSIIDFTPEQLTNIAEQLQRLAEQKHREINPVLLRNMLQCVDSVVSAGDLLVESIERLRNAAILIRHERALAEPGE
jgi:hypothetical protein